MIAAKGKYGKGKYFTGKYIKFNKISVFENIRKISRATSCLIIFS